MNGILQLARRGLGEESWRLGSHLVRGLLALFLLLVILEARSNQGAARGLPIFRTQVLLTHLFLTINAIFGFSQIIIEERESGTLDLLKLAGIRQLSILLGKTFPRFWDCCLLIAVQFPFTLLTLTIGGVGWPQVLAAYVGLLAYLVLVAGIGLFASAFCDSSRGAVGLSTFIVFIYLYPLIVGTIGSGSAVFGLHKYNLQLDSIDIMQSGFARTPWSPAVLFAIAFGFLFSIGSWFGIARRKSSALSLLSQWWRKHIGVGTRERVWSSALIWKEYRYLTGGILRIGFRIALFLVLILWMMSVHGNFGMACVWAALLAVPVGIIDGTWTASRLFSPEIQQQTLPLLALTPHKLQAIARDKTLGWLLGISPTIIIPGLMIPLTILFHPHVDDFDDQFELVLGSIVVCLSILAYLHMMVLFSLDWHWKAIPFTLSLASVAVFVYITLLVPWNSSATYQRWGLFVFTGVVMIGLMKGIQWEIVKRLKQLAGTA